MLFASMFIFKANETYSQKEKLSFNERQWLDMERHFGINSKEKDSAALNLYQLSKHKEYEQALILSKELWRKNRYTKDYFAFYASALYNLGYEDSARALTIEYLKDWASEDFSISSLHIFTQYPCFYNIGKDEIINQFIYEAYLDKYKKQNPQNLDLGIKLIQLCNSDQSIRYELYYDLVQSNNEADSIKAREKFIAQALIDQDMILQMYAAHPKYISEKEVGEVSGFQGILIWHFGGKGEKVTNIFFPMLKVAMEEQEITPDEYIDQLTQKYFRPGGDFQKGKQATDSLCKVYGCTGIYTYSE